MLIRVIEIRLGPINWLSGEPRGMALTLNPGRPGEAAGKYADKLHDGRLVIYRYPRELPRVTWEHGTYYG